MRTSEAVSAIDAPAVGGSLLAFVIVYFAVFGAGVFYILRLLAQPPESGENGLGDMPIRAAGITPAAGIDRDSANLPPEDEGYVT
jgi:cytochrome d ubiquinol oxidase subunit I